MTVILGKNSIVARVFREYDPETKKTVYTAIDAQGNPIYQDEQTLSGLKKRFIQAQKEINSPEQDLDENTIEPLKVTKCDKFQEREDELKRQRALKKLPGKQNEINR